MVKKDYLQHSSVDLILIHPLLSLANHLHPHASKLMVQFAILDVFGTKSWPGVFLGGNGFFTSKMSQISPSHLHVAHQHGGTETMHATWEWQRLIPTAMLPRTRIYFPHPCTTNRNLSQVKGGWSLFKETTLGLETKTSMFFSRFLQGDVGMRFGKGMMEWFFELAQNWNHDQQIIKPEKNNNHHK